MIKRYAKDTKLVIGLSIIDNLFSMNIFLTFFTFCHFYKSQERDSEYQYQHFPSIFQFKHGQDNERMLREINHQLGDALGRADKMRKKLAELNEDNALVSEIDELNEKLKQCEKGIPHWPDLLDKFIRDKDAYEKLVPRGDKKKIDGKETYFDLLFPIKHTINNHQC